MNKAISWIIVLSSLATVAAAPERVLAFGRDGGSGLLDVAEAYSLPLGRPLFSLHAGYYSKNITPGSSRLFTLTPSMTLGLGAGFEGAAAVPIEGLTSSLHGGPFDRRFDFRSDDLATRLRWTTALGTTRLRAGVQGVARIPLGDSTRPGGDQKPERGFDPGLEALLSTNLGWFDFPLRLHANAGYWWSRDDGAFYYRELPLPLPISGVPARDNDVLSFGLGLEAGLRRAVVFMELTTEQLIDARSAVHGKENLWRLTPGFATQLSSTIGLTGAVAFDLSANDPATSFNPTDVYPDTELQVSLTMGSVLSRNLYEEAHRSASAPLRAAPTPAAPPPVPPAASPAVSPAVVESGAVSTPAAEAPRAPAPPPESETEQLRDLEQRLDRLEMRERLARLEGRLRELELGDGGAAAPEPATPTTPVAPAAPAARAAPAAPTVSPSGDVAPSSTSGDTLASGRAGDAALRQTVADLQAQVRALQAAADTAAAASPPARAEGAPLGVPADTAATRPAVRESTADTLRIGATTQTGGAAPAPPAPTAADTEATAGVAQPAAPAEIAAGKTAGLPETPPGPAAVPAGTTESPTGSPLATSTAAPKPAAAEPTVAAPDSTAAALAREVAALRAEVASLQVAEQSAPPTTAPPQAGSSPLTAELTRLIADLEREREAYRADRLAATDNPPTTMTVVTDSPRQPGTSPVLVPVQQPILAQGSGSAAVSPPPAPEESRSSATAAAGIANAPPAEAPAVPIAAASTPAGIDSLAAVFPLPVGGRQVLEGFTLSGERTLADPENQALLQRLADRLRAHPKVRVALLVHGGGPDHEAALRTTEETAAAMRDFLILAGAAAQQVVPFGMGLAEPLVSPDSPDAAQLNQRVEVERLQ